MTLLSPAALWTLAALALPLAIHLWRRPPRTVPFGSLRFLQGRPRPLQNLRWREYALLAARLGLLALLAVGLARPLWRQPPTTRPPRWALIDPAAAPAGESLERLRALRSNGAETRLLAPGFPVVAAPPAEASAPAPDVWSLLREADATLPAGSSMAVFSPGRLASLRGVRPALAHLRVEWVQTPGAPTPTVAPPTPTPTASPLTVVILHDADRAEDARAVAAALRAVSRVDQRPLTVTVAVTAPPFPAADWIFWLGAQPVPPAITTSAANVFHDAATPAADTPPGWIVPAAGTAEFGPPVRLWRRIPPTAGSVIWTDGFGQALLTSTHDAHGTRWHFASRFSPAWNDLSLGAALPASLRTLLAVPRAEPADDSDRRLADPAQFSPSETPAASFAKLPPPGTEIDLRPAFWFLAVLLFGLERFLSHRSAPRFSAPAPAPAEPVLSQ